MRNFIFDGVGTGKTKRALNLIDEAGVDGLIVICPASVISTTWARQIPKWSPRDSVAYRGAFRDQALRCFPDKVLVMSYEMADKIDLRKIRHKYSLIVDESHYCKNPRSKRSKAVRKLSDHAEHLLMLTGTPTRKDLEDIYGQTMILYPDKQERMKQLGEAFDTLGSFRSAFGVPHTQWINGRATDKWSYPDNSANRVANILSNYVLPMRTSDIEVPAYEMMQVQRRPEEIEAFTKWDKERELNDEVYAATASAKANKLAQLDDGFAYDVNHHAYRFGGSKVERVLTAVITEKIGKGKPVLVWVKYKAVADVLLPRRDCMSVLSFVGLDDAERARAAAGLTMIVGNYQSVGTGVDGLQDYMSTQIWVDLPYTYADFSQANARLVRRGQSDTPRIVVLDTDVNRSIMDVVEGRRTLDAMVKEPILKDK